MTDIQTPKTFVGRFFEPDNDTRNLILAIGIVVVSGLGLGIFSDDGKFLSSLKDSDVSRGLITFLVAVTTVSIAIILALYAVTANDTDALKDRFSLGKEVLTTLVGILGTILGFYFGSADKGGTEQFTIADITFQGTQIRTHVAGGVFPYRYSITAGNQNFSKIDNHISKDGWIFEVLDKQPSQGTQITIDVSDAKGKTTSKTVAYSDITATSAAASLPKLGSSPSASATAAASTTDNKTTK